jgi:hypothetical protein
MDIVTRYCKHCRTYHSLTNEFWLQTGGKTRCRLHYAETTRKWRKKNKDRVKNSNAIQKQTVGTRFSQTRSNAIKRGIQFNLTITDFQFLTIRNCYYCTSNEKIGIDRIDNDLGYIVNNCVPCCKLCNLTRNRLYTHDEFITFMAPAIRQVLLCRQIQN